MPSLDVAGSLFLLALIAGPVLAAIALVAAHRHGRTNAADYGVVFVPVITFIVIGGMRDELRTGWALFIWPVLIAAGSTYLLAAKILLVDRFVKDTKRSSLGLFVSLALAAASMGIFVPQLLE